MVNLQVGRLGVRFDAPEGDVEEARREFDRVHCLTLPAFLDPELLANVQSRLAASPATARTYSGIGSEGSIAFGPSRAALDLVMNDAVLFEAIGALTGLAPIGCFIGRVYTMRPGDGGFAWHDDDERGRMVGLSVNLGQERFTGGVLQIAEVGSETIVREVANVGAGDGVIFRIGPEVMHRVTPVGGSAQRVAYSGWFCATPSYRELFHARLGLHDG